MAQVHRQMRPAFDNACSTDIGIRAKRVKNFFQDGIIKGIRGDGERESLSVEGLPCVWVSSTHMKGEYGRTHL